MPTAPSGRNEADKSPRDLQSDIFCVFIENVLSISRTIPTKVCVGGLMFVMHLHGPFLDVSDVEVSVHVCSEENAF